ncbi:hypothetical protein ACRALDRAFT_210419 [Sodiomyces alcalophilus JCM 7366]|uniref:uncharacterized protein n=1 Tax=Sodiomyces alcalophilus JCM 7366 TaxID=591952 RepID=UPI0039B47865
MNEQTKARFWKRGVQVPTKLCTKYTFSRTYQFYILRGQAGVLADPRRARNNQFTFIASILDEEWFVPGQRDLHMPEMFGRDWHEFLTSYYGVTQASPRPYSQLPLVSKMTISKTILRHVLITPDSFAYWYLGSSAGTVVLSTEYIGFKYLGACVSGYDLGKDESFLIGTSESVA